MGDTYRLVEIAQRGKITFTESNPMNPAVPVLSVQYELSGKPYQEIDYGISFAAGIQKKISPDLTFQLLFTGQTGFADIKNTAVQYSDGSLIYRYFDNLNGSMIHKNHSLAVTAGLKKSFTWTPAPETEKKKFRIFRYKL